MLQVGPQYGIHHPRHWLRHGSHQVAQAVPAIASVQNSFGSLVWNFNPSVGQTSHGKQIVPQVRALALADGFKIKDHAGGMVNVAVKVGSEKDVLLPTLKSNVICTLKVWEAPEFALKLGVKVKVL